MSIRFWSLWLAVVLTFAGFFAGVAAAQPAPRISAPAPGASSPTPGTSAPAVGDWHALAVNPNISITYTAPQSAQLQPVYQRFKDRQVLEEYQRFLAPLRLPHPLRMQAKQCNQVNAFYSPTDRSLTVCYELVAFFESQAPQTVTSDGFITRDASIAGGVIGTLLHESGHMMFDMFDVPVFGREEDAADETAAFLALQFSKDVARTVIKGFVYQWAVAKDPDASAPMSAYSDVHGSASQRMYNTLCLGYGGDPKTFQDFVDKGYLPQSRAASCPTDFALVKFAFETTIFPFVDDSIMARVKQAQWLTPTEMQ